MLLEIRDGSVSRQGQPVLSHFDFEIRGTEKIAVVGRNGAGKTTLLDVLNGSAELELNEKNRESGVKKARAFTVGMLEQQTRSSDQRSVSVCVEEAVLSGRSDDFRFSEERFALEREFERMFTGLGFSKDDREKKLSEFSGGENVKIRLILLLLARPDVLILDEPTNHLDLASVEWLEMRVRDYPGAVVMVSHDRFFLDRTADVVWEVSGGKLVRYPGNYTKYREQKTANLEKERKAWERQQDEIQKQKELIERFRHKPRKAAFARSRKKMLERMQPVQKPEEDDAVIRTGEILPLRRGSKSVYECEHLKIGYDREIRELSFRIRRGQKIGVMGANGTGKSAFLRTLAGVLEPLGGKQSVGVNVDAAYFDQQSASITSDERVIDWFHNRYPSLPEKEVRTILAGYLFYGKDMGKKVNSLSGGEKARLVLASLMQSRPNLLILDEPTNHMDIPAKETLESVFRNYRGTIVFVSHDRYFLGRVAESLLIFEEEKDRVSYYPFGYNHYLERRDRGDAGEDLSLVRSAENQRLLDELRAVPKGERHRIRELSTEEAIISWEFEQNHREREKAELFFRSLCEEWEKMLQKKREIPETLEAYMNPEASETRPGEPAAAGAEGAAAAELRKRIEEARDAWTETLLAWYDIWQDTREAAEEEKES
uniref:ABC-F family ATP-binding cassette domain-containing protein n=1 Tax=Eubacterium cellulosolvens TaxID=29322 RepID=UPI000484C1FF|nr:ABC-F family ATP-binding cassette domain-containing protein [[Eubacterium] cellulosolvens]